MGDHFFVYEQPAVLAVQAAAAAGGLGPMPHELTFLVKRARFVLNAVAPQIGHKSDDADFTVDPNPFAHVKLINIKWRDAQIAANIVGNRISHTADIRLTNVEANAAGQQQPAMTDNEAIDIIKWAEQLCSAQSLERTPWLSLADRRNIVHNTKVWNNPDSLWKCPFARIQVQCMPTNAGPANAYNHLNVVPQCRRAILADYTPCSTHMWDHLETTQEDRLEIALRWQKEALTRRLAASFRTPEAANNDDRTSFDKVRRLLVLYLFVSAITTGTAQNNDFRGEAGDGDCTAVFVKSLHR